MPGKIHEETLIACNLRVSPIHIKARHRIWYIAAAESKEASGLSRPARPEEDYVVTSLGRTRPFLFFAGHAAEENQHHEREDEQQSIRCSPARRLRHAERNEARGNCVHIARHDVLL